jgi:hypothetical protein
VVAHRPEVDLLLHSVRVLKDPDAIRLVREILIKGIDWGPFLATAARHRMLSLLYHFLSRACLDALPRERAEQMRRHFLFNGARNLYLVGELFKLLELFEGNGIPAIPFKGPILGSLAYGNFSLREFGDLDILVPEDHVLRAVDLIGAFGYQNRLVLTRRQAAAYLSEGCEFTFERMDKTVTVDLHWKILRDHAFPFDVKGLWNRMEPVSLAGREVMSLPMKDVLLVHCAHGSKHQWERLEWIVGLSSLLEARCAKVDWESLIAQARSLGSERMLLLGLALARDLGTTMLPNQIDKRINSQPVLRSLVQSVRDRLFIEPEGEQLLERTDRQNVFHLRMRERWRDRFHYLNVRLLRFLKPTSRDQEMVPVPRALSFVLYLTRPIRLCREYGGQTFSSLKRMIRSFLCP